MIIGGRQYLEVWLADFEFHAPPGHRPEPLCMVGYELGSGRTIRMWQDELKQRDHLPFATGADVLYVAYFSSAEFSCHLALGWELPVNVVDLYVEFRNATNGLPTPAGNGLLGALVYFGLDSMGTAEKENLRDLAIRGGPFTKDERDALLSYCGADVMALRKLWGTMAPSLDVPRALLRGNYMKAVAKMEWNGVPIDQDALDLLRNKWESIQDELIRKIDSNYGVYEEQTFKVDRFATWLAQNNVPWPRLESGQLALDDDTFRTLSRHYPQLILLRQLRVALSEMRLSDLSIGPDARNRALLSPFASRTGRNQPSNSKFIFGPSVWLRYLIRPKPGTGLAYLDFEQQEFGIAAALSQDPKMLEAYQSGDPYLSFAKQANAVPSTATKITHAAIRELFKTCALGTQYGMEFESLARRIERSPAEARELLRLHRETYRTFWKWSDAAVDSAMLTGKISTAFGWTLQIDGATNTRCIRNYPMQGNGAEILRFACSIAIDQGIKVCAPVHDAILVEAPLEHLEEDVRSTQAAMAWASRIVLDGPELRIEAKLFRAPARFEDSRGAEMWNQVQGILSNLQVGAA
jgi:DNA polymerase I